MMKADKESIPALKSSREEISPGKTNKSDGPKSNRPRPAIEKSMADNKLEPETTQEDL